jgi:predicted nucleotidyltransferase
MNDIREEIRRQLQILEQERAIKILYAVESGSRAWGFESVDSDWDVRFIYIHQVNWYLQIDDKKDSIEVMLPHDIDMAGWELKKALKLFRKSNPPLLEWLSSPIVYFDHSSLPSLLRELTGYYFKPKSCLHHYLHMAEGNYRNYLQGEVVRSKKYFYVLRPVLACQWIEERGTMPPMEFQSLLAELLHDESVRREILQLLVRKMSGEEMKEELRNSVLNNYLDERIKYFTEKVKTFPKAAMADTARLNDVFFQLMSESW